MNLICSICNAEFTCGANSQGNCWCDQLPNIMPVEGSSCLCPKCLGERIKEREEEIRTQSANNGEKS